MRFRRNLDKRNTRSEIAKMDLQASFRKQKRIKPPLALKYYCPRQFIPDYIFLSPVDSNSFTPFPPLLAGQIAVD